MGFWKRSEEPLPYVPIAEQRRRASEYFDDPQRWVEKERMLVQKQWTGEVTLCCKQFECRCGQNVRWVNGQAAHFPGLTLPGSDYDRYLKNVRNAPDLRSGAYAVDQYFFKGQPPTPLSPSYGKGYSLLHRERDLAKAARAEQNANETTGPIPRIQ